MRLMIVDEGAHDYRRLTEIIEYFSTYYVVQYGLETVLCSS